MSRQKFEDDLDREVNLFLDEFETDVANMWPFDPDHKTEVGKLGDSMRRVRALYQLEVKAVVRTSIWFLERDEEARENENVKK